MLAFLLAFALIAIVSGNNLPACSGTIIGSRMVKRRAGILITILGYSTGLLLQGSMLKKSIDAILPNRSIEMLFVALLIALIIFIIAHKKRVPQSLSVSFTGILIGIALAEGSPVNWYFTSFIFAFWIIATIASALIMIPLMRLSRNEMRKGSIWRKTHYIKISLIVLSFFTAFTLGANTLGLVYSALPKGALSISIAVLAIIVGSFAFSSGETETISDNIISMRYLNSINAQLVSTAFVEGATMLGMPLSNTQTLTASVFGAGLSYKSRILLKKPLKAILSVWITGIAVSMPLAFIMAKAFIIA